MLQCSRATLRKLALIGCINRPVLVDILDVETVMSRLSELRTGRWQGAPLSLTSPISGFRLRGRNDGCSFPRRRESTAAGRRWVPVSGGNRRATGGRTAQSGSRPPRESTAGGGRRWVHNRHSHDGNGGRQRRTHNRHSRDGGNPRRGAGDGFPSPRGTTGGSGAPTIVIPATAGIHGGAGDGFPSPRERRAGGGAHTIVIPATAGIHRGGPAMGSRLHRNDGGRRRTHNRHSRDGGNPHRGPAMGSRLHGNDGGRRRTHNRHPRDGGNPQRGAGDGFPSPRERREAAGAPTIVIPATAGIHRGGAGDGFPSPPERRQAAGAPNSSFPRRRESTAGPAMGSRLHGNDGGRRRTHNRHSRDGGNPQRGPAMGSRPHGNDGRRRAHPTIVIPATAGIHRGGPPFLSAAPNRYRGGRGLARRRTCDTMTSAGIDGRPTRRRPAAATLVGSRQAAAQRTCKS